jgi:hypothetical protein
VHKKCDPARINLISSTCTPATTAVTQRSLIPTLNSTPPDTTWCSVCVPFVRPSSALLPPVQCEHARYPCAHIRTLTRHHTLTFAYHVYLLATRHHPSSRCVTRSSCLIRIVQTTTHLCRGLRMRSCVRVCVAFSTLALQSVCSHVSRSLVSLIVGHRSRSKPPRNTAYQGKSRVCTTHTPPPPPRARGKRCPP